MTFSELEAAEAILATLSDSRWIGTGLAQAYLWVTTDERESKDVARYL